MGRASQFSPEVRERAVRLVLQHQAEHEPQRESPTHCIAVFLQSRLFRGSGNHATFGSCFQRHSSYAVSATIPSSGGSIVKPEFRLFLLPDCVVNPSPKPKAGRAVLSLLGLFAPKLIELAIGGVATLLKKAGGDHTVHAAGHVFSNLYIADKDQVLQPNPEIGCLLGVFGEFPASESKDASRDPGVERIVKAGLIPRGSAVYVLFESAIRPTADATAFFLDTRHISVREFIGDGMKSERALVATLNVTAPSATADGDSIAIGNIDFGRVSRGADLIPRTIPSTPTPATSPTSCRGARSTRRQSPPMTRTSSLARPPERPTCP